MILRDSDIEQPRDRLPPVLAAMSPLPCPFDLFVWTTGEFERAARGGAALAREVLEHGLELLDENAAAQHPDRSHRVDHVTPMTVFTLGYGGRGKDECLALLKAHGVKTVVDVRLRPDRASMGIWVKAKTPDKGIEQWLAAAGIGYRSLVELGNVFLEFPDWRERYRRLLDAAGALLTERLDEVPGPICLLCAERRVAECHRQQVAVFLAAHRGVVVQHLE